jgi:hypothetical protein
LKVLKSRPTLPDSRAERAAAAAVELKATPEVSMPIKPSAAKITDFETSFDAAPVATAEGEVIWADVRIDYILAGLTPSVTIRIPVPWREGDTPEARKSMALRCARELIDHACIAAGIPSPPIPTPGFRDTIADALPALEGVAQELGLAEPSTQPKKMRAPV